jgi:hypothetical protein
MRKPRMTLQGYTPEEKRARQRGQQEAWRRAHPEKSRLYAITYNAKPEARELKKVWHQKNKERIAATRKLQYRTFVDGLTPEELETVRGVRRASAVAQKLKRNERRETAARSLEE